MVGLEALDVGSETFGGEVGAAGVDRDADGEGKFAGNAGFLRDNIVSKMTMDYTENSAVSSLELTYFELDQREPTTGAHSAVVFDTRATDNRAELINWSWSNSYSFGVASISTTQLAARLAGGVRLYCGRRERVMIAHLIEMASNSTLPVLTEV